MPDFLKFRYTQRTGSWLSIITLVAYILTKVSVTALTGGIFFEYLWGLNFWVGAIGLIILTTIFTVFGGMKGVMTLSTIQTPILVIGHSSCSSSVSLPSAVEASLQVGQI